MSQPANSSGSASSNSASQNSSRYQKIRELGRSDRGHRITYLAKDNKVKKTVVIKQYIFGNSQSDWAGLKAYETHAKTLLNLKHPSLPRYLNFFPSKDGFCAVREFKQATSLAAFRHLNLEIVHKITVSLLETLAYLQNQSPFILHYNIKPENILVDDRLNIYLVDFGFLYIDKQGKMRASFAGTSGFMPREQLRNKTLTEASDLYAAGASLACLVAQIPSRTINNLLARDSRISLVEAIPKEISFKFVEWLEGLLKPSLNQRYANALAALEALEEIDLKRSPQARIKPNAIDLKSEEYGEKLIVTISINNTVPDTLLQGKWELLSQTNNKLSSSSNSNWIVFDPPQFESNRISCDVIVNTKKLQAEQIYERQIILHANDEEKTHAIALKIKTAPLVTEKLPWLHFGILLVVGLLGGSLYGILFGLIERFSGAFPNYVGFLMGLTIGGIGGVASSFHNYDLLKKMLGLATALGIMSWLLSLRLFLGLFMGIRLYNRIPLLIGTLIGIFVFAVAGYILRYSYGQPIQSKEFIVLREVLSTKGLIVLLIATLGIFMGLGLNAGLFNPFILFCLILIGTPLGIMLYRFHASQVKLLTKYRKAKPHLLKP